jgi:nitrite reductase/ring-hydroxylating ferredoxin subunit
LGDGRLVFYSMSLTTEDRRVKAKTNNIRNPPVRLGLAPVWVLTMIKDQMVSKVTDTRVNAAWRQRRKGPERAFVGFLVSSAPFEDSTTRPYAGPDPPGTPLVIVEIARGVLQRCETCVHIALCPSFGRFDGTRLECPYHGWQFDIDGRCRHILTLVDDGDLQAEKLVRTYPACDQDAMCGLHTR